MFQLPDLWQLMARHIVPIAGCSQAFAVVGQNGVEDPSMQPAPQLAYTVSACRT